MNRNTIAGWALALLLAACGGGGDGGGTPPGGQNPPIDNPQSLSVAVTGAGTVSSAPAGIDCGGICQANFSQGASVVLTAVPAANQSFAGWGGACSGSQVTCAVLVSEARNVSAAFVPNNGSSFALTASTQGSGVVTSQPAGIDCGATCAAQYAANTAVTLTATPAAGQVFSAWSGDCAGSVPSCSLTMNANKSARAVFVTPQTAGWQAQALLSPAGSFQHGFPRTAMAADGSVLATWLQQIDNNQQVLAYAIWSRVYRPGTGWGTPAEVVRTAPSIDKDGYQLAMNASGQAVLVWVDIRAGTTSTYDISAMAFDLTSGWGARSAINSQTSGPGNLSAGVDGNGNAMVTWQQAKPAGQVPAGRGVWANRYAGGAWGTAQVLNANLDEGAINPKIAVTPSGDAIAVWRGFGRAGVGGLWTSKYTPGGSWSAPDNTVAITGTRFDVGNNPAIVANGSSGATLVWWQIDLLPGPPATFQRSLWALNYSGGGWSGAALSVSTPRVGTPPSDENEVRPVLASNAHNQVAVAWTWSNQPQTVWVNRSRSDGTWETPLAANGVDAGDLSNHKVGIDDAGNVIASWYNSRTANIITNRFTQGAGWSQSQTMVAYDNTSGLLAAGALATNPRGDAVLVYQMNPDIVRQGSQVFSRYFVSGP